MNSIQLKCTAHEKVNLFRFHCQFLVDSEYRVFNKQLNVIVYNKHISYIHIEGIARCKST